MTLTGVIGFPSPFHVAPIKLPRKFEDSSSLRLGGEYRLAAGGVPLSLRAGLAYEQSAVPAAYQSALTLDLDKVLVSLGASVTLAQQWRLDLLLAHVFGVGTTVLPGEAKVPRVNPVAGNPTQTEAINGGRYDARSDVVGLGLAYAF